MSLKALIELYDNHTHEGGPPPVLREIKERFPVGSFVIDDRGSVGLVIHHQFTNPPQGMGSMAYGSVMFIGPQGRMWTEDFLSLEQNSLRRISKLELLAIAADRETTELDSLMRLAEIHEGKIE